MALNVRTAEQAVGRLGARSAVAGVGVGEMPYSTFFWSACRKFSVDTRTVKNMLVHSDRDSGSSSQRMCAMIIWFSRFAPMRDAITL